ncbi:hypothetical protein CERZMDRAFT_114980 [Cercospora zeae-maydis SCOH1-5]|uniref:non-specific serine/threonine protein kinase n=1 Tax=Cercospora zeae-maydis SCOH1-5 TaxID=717836 RepID=A0A6A6F3S2_9PEZI|nr:hypothetical protein CERZMDRAFT_114980 [Cercospora zeae-maydis SCOH1-5]
MPRLLKGWLPSFGPAKVTTKTTINEEVTPTSRQETPGQRCIASPKDTFHRGRYEAIRQLGSGGYSDVWLARDLQKKSFVALKLLTADCYDGNHDIFEVDILKAVSDQQNKLEDNSKSHVVELLDVFETETQAGTHRCIAMPVFGCDLDAQARRFPGRRVPVQIMKEITRQLLLGVEFLHSSCRVIHTASWVNKHLSDNIQPEHLRAPEVIIGASWILPWISGVIEFTKGHVAFPGAASPDGAWSSEDDHLAQYMEVLGPMPSALLQRGSKTSKYFDEDGRLLRIPKLQNTSLRAYLDGKDEPFRRPSDMDEDEVPVFVDFLRGALALDPVDRRTATELLQHQWLQGSPA